MLVGFSQKVIAEGDDRRDVLGALFRCVKQVGNKSIPFFRLLAKGINLLKLIDEYHQRKRPNLRQHAGNALQSVILTLRIRAHEFVAQLASLRHGSQVVSGNPR